MSLLGSLRLAIPLGVLVVVMATLFRTTFRSAPLGSRRRLRRSVVLYVFYLVLISAKLVVERWAPGFTSGFRVASELCELFLVINLAALAVFDVLLPWTRVRVPSILHDISVGATYLLGILWSIHRWGVDLTSIVATSAVVTAVLGLSLQSTLGNVIGGLALQVDDSISEGDWIELENKTQGQVKKVRWRHTVIETRDWDTLIVPNSLLLGQTIKILGKREGERLQHRMTLYFNVDHRYAPGHVIRIVTEALTSAPIPGVADAPPPNAICFDLARENRDSFCYYAVRYFLTDLARDDLTNSHVRERIYSALRRAQIPLALPAATLFVSQDDGRTERTQKKQVNRARAALRSVEILARLSEEELTNLSQNAQIAPFVAGEIITRQGAASRFFYVLMTGQAEVRVSAENGEERRVAVIEAPSFFGEMGVLTGAPREATVVALNDVECLQVKRSDFHKVLAGRPDLVNDISNILAQRRVELEAARDLDANSKHLRVMNERGRIFTSIKDFFGLTE